MNSLYISFENQFVFRFSRTGGRGLGEKSTARRSQSRCSFDSNFQRRTKERVFSFLVLLVFVRVLALCWKIFCFFFVCVRLCFWGFFFDTYTHMSLFVVYLVSVANILVFRSTSFYRRLFDLRARSSLLSRRRRLFEIRRRGRRNHRP